jgi:hypothetical protein
LLRITVAKIIAGSESKKHYLLETLLSFSNENLKKQNEMEWIYYLVSNHNKMGFMNNMVK